MNFHAFWRPELKAMGDLLADRIVGPRLSPGAARRPGSGDRPGAVCAITTARATTTRAIAAVGGLNDRRETLCYPGAVPGV
jgi:hypothetical protein